MPKPSVLHFVRGLIGGQTAHFNGSYYATPDGRRGAKAEVRALIQAGALSGNLATCRANEETAGWLKRTLIDRDAFQAQHRLTDRDAAGREINLKESPLSRLAVGETAFLERHHIEAGERVRRLVEQAQLRHRTTMNYSGVAGEKSRGNAQGDLSDLAADARKAVAEIYRSLPADCAGVVVDVCGWLKGLQEIERERGWPRRSAKLVLRIGLDHLAQIYGISPYAVGERHRKTTGWLADGARPDLRG